MNVLIAADGSEYTCKAARYVASQPAWLQADSQLHVFHARPAYRLRPRRGRHLPRVAARCRTGALIDTLGTPCSDRPVLEKPE
jgi:hypothetical protein